MRLVIFALLGPLIGLLPFHIWTWATAKAGFSYPLWPWGLPLMVFGAYIVGFIPAWFTGAADWFSHPGWMAGGERWRQQALDISSQQ